jgi:hypothetical protein
VDVIPDIVGHRPRVVFCGLVCAESANVRDHYYANPTNNFWDMRHRSGLTPSANQRKDDDGSPDRLSWWRTSPSFSTGCNPPPTRRSGPEIRPRLEPLTCGFTRGAFRIARISPFHLHTSTDRRTVPLHLVLTTM